MSQKHSVTKVALCDQLTLKLRCTAANKTERQEGQQRGCVNFPQGTAMVSSAGHALYKLTCGYQCTDKLEIHKETLLEITVAELDSPLS